MTCFMWNVRSERGRSWFSSTSYLLRLCVILTPMSIPLCLCSDMHCHRLVKGFTRCFSLFFLPSVCPVSVKFSRPTFLMSQKLRVSHLDCKYKLLCIFCFPYTSLKSMTVSRNRSFLNYCCRYQRALLADFVKSVGPAI